MSDFHLAIVIASLFAGFLLLVLGAVSGPPLRQQRDWIRLVGYTLFIFAFIRAMKLYPHWVAISLLLAAFVAGFALTWRMKSGFMPPARCAMIAAGAGFVALAIFWPAS